MSIQITALTRLCGIACASLCALPFNFGHAAETPSPRDKARMSSEAQIFYSSLALSSIQLSKTSLGSQDSVLPACSLVNRSSKEIVAPSSGEQSGSLRESVGMVEWALRRKDGKPFASYGYGYGTNREGQFILFRGIVVISTLKPGEAHKLPAWEIDVTKLNLASGSCEITVQFIPISSVRTFPKLVAGPVGFTVDNPLALTPAQVAQKRKDEMARRATLSRQVLSALRLSEMTLSISTIPKGGTLSAACRLSNPSDKNLVIPEEFSKQALCEQWYLTKQPAKGGVRDPYGGGLLSLPEEGSFGAGKSMDISLNISTSQLEIGTYEVAVEVTDVSNAVIGLRKQKFKVVK